MPEYDAFGREIGEDTLAGWRTGSSGLPAPPPEHERDAPKPRPAPTPVTAGDPLGTPVASAPSAASAPSVAGASPAPSAPRPRIAFGPPRRRRRIRLRWIALLIAGWVGFNFASNVADKVDEAARDFKVPTIGAPAPEAAAPAPAGLAAGSLLRPAAFERALGDLRGRGIGRIQNLRVAPERIDATLLTRRGTLVHVQLRSGGEFQRFSESGAGFGALETISYSRLDASAPRRLVRAAAERLGRPVSRIDYLVPTLTAGELTWGAYFKGGAIFLADERGRITRRIS